MDCKQELRRLLARSPANSWLKYTDHVDTGWRYFSASANWIWRALLPSRNSALRHGARAKYVVQDFESGIFTDAGSRRLFERERHQEPVAGWHSCVVASAVRF